MSERCPPGAPASRRPDGDVGPSPTSRIKVFQCRYWRKMRAMNGVFLIFWIPAFAGITAHDGRRPVEMSWRVGGGNFDAWRQRRRRPTCCGLPVFIDSLRPGPGSASRCLQKFWLDWKTRPALYDSLTEQYLRRDNPYFLYGLPSIIREKIPWTSVTKLLHFIRIFHSCIKGKVLGQFVQRQGLPDRDG